MIDAWRILCGSVLSSVLGLAPNGESNRRAVMMNLLSFYQWLYETTDGRFTWLAGLPVLLLRTKGRKSGVERTAALVYLQDGKDLVVVASNGGSDHPPAWLLNIEKNVNVEGQNGRDQIG